MHQPLGNALGARAVRYIDSAARVLVDGTASKIASAAGAAVKAMIE
jgi:hypothetical protein